MKSKKAVTRLFLIFSLIILLFNLTPIADYIGLEPIVEVYHYENTRGQEIIEIPSKGKKVDLKELGLKRKFKKNYLKFWKWSEYMTHPRWQIDYYD